jgi:hypothetical protein
MDEHEALLDEWGRRPLHVGRCFIKDGIINVDLWQTAKPRILFLLKEAYGAPGTTANDNWDLRERLRNDGPRWQTWVPAARWSYAIQEIASRGFSEFPNDDDAIARALLSSAIVNIRKSGGGSASSSTELRNCVRDDGWFLRKQIDLIDPRIVVCGSTWGHVKELWPEASKAYNLVWRTHNRLFVDFWHPSNRCPKEMAYYALAGLFQYPQSLSDLRQ